MRALLTLLVDDGPGFHSNVPVSKLTERDARAIKASVISSAPLVVEIEDRVTHESRPTPSKPTGLGGLELLDTRSKGQGSKASLRKA